MLKKAYLEITNVCNLSCSFCHGTKRAKGFMTEEEFVLAASRIRGHAKYLYFHLMGEPLLHPLLGRFLEIAGEMGFRVILTTNGTLLSERMEILLSSPALHKVSISLHSFEGDGGEAGERLWGYLDTCFDAAEALSRAGVVSVMRLWNEGGADRMNGEILESLRRRFPWEWTQTYSGERIGDGLYLEWGKRFDWPDADGEDMGAEHSCYGLRDQVGILWDGTVVPCCLDAEGTIPLGNIFEAELGDILSGERAVKLKRSFEERNIEESLCRRCGFAAARFGRR